MALKYDEIAIPKKYDGNEYTTHHAQLVKINTNCFKHKKYPNCKCGAKYVPIRERGMCPRCYAEIHR